MTSADRQLQEHAIASMNAAFDVHECVAIAINFLVVSRVSHRADSSKQLWSLTSISGHPALHKPLS
jgi:hypothetical protein